MKAYFDKVQRDLGTRETVVPLDVIDAFQAAARRKDPQIVRVNQYPCRTCGERPRHAAVRRD